MIMMKQAFVLLIGVLIQCHLSLSQVSYYDDGDRLYVSNGFVRLEFDKHHPCIDTLYADHTGSLPAASVSYSSSNNLLTSYDGTLPALRRRGIVLEMDVVTTMFEQPSPHHHHHRRRRHHHDDHQSNANESVNAPFNVFTETASSSDGATGSVNIEVQASTPQLLQLTIHNITTFAVPTPSTSSSSSSSMSNMIRASWYLSLAEYASSFNFSMDLELTAPVTPTRILSARTSVYFTSPSVTGLFERGVVQMMNSYSNQFYFGASDSQLHAVYSMGDQKGSVYLYPYSSSSSSSTQPRHTISRHGSPQHEADASPSYVLLSSSALSGVQLVHAGTYPSMDSWNNRGWIAANPVGLPAGTSMQLQFHSFISANQFDFPIVNDAATITTLNRDADPQLYDDLRAFQTSLYGGCVGSLVTYLVPHVGSPTIASPQHAYEPLYSFYDPDNWLTVTALAYSGVPYLQNQARLMLESHLSGMLSSGQLPHHFIGDTSNPTYVAISGATQTGPNIYWTLAALSYARNSGDTAWFRSHLSEIQTVVSFLTNMVDKQRNLLLAEGPLFIDVFVRNNFTTDSNAAMIQLLKEMSEAEQYVGDTVNAQKHSQLANDISVAMRKYLWAKPSSPSSVSDHFLTQLNQDGSTRDFVDYDANFLAVTANALLTSDEQRRIVSRLDNGTCTRKGRATWVSEVFYDSNNCYSGNTGDSAVTMGRIAYYDAHAHVKTGQVDIVQNEILLPLLSDVFNMTYLPERYTCDGQPTHNPAMHEYTELIVMLLREIAYGIQLSFSTLIIQPLLRSQFDYQLGNVRVQYSLSHVVFNVAGDGQVKHVSVYGLTINSEYVVVVNDGTNKFTVQTDATGLLQFDAAVSNQFTYDISLV